MIEKSQAEKKMKKRRKAQKEKNSEREINKARGVSVSKYDHRFVTAPMVIDFNWGKDLLFLFLSNYYFFPYLPYHIVPIS
jgi:hypothetical protein